jgi:CO dehydrogenase/acetyl-CoA synthase delta subunit
MSEEKDDNELQPDCECSGCCGSSRADGQNARPRPPADLDEPWIAGRVPTAAGAVPVVATRLKLRDRLGSLRARLGVGRMRYAIPPGLYAVGRPDAGSRVFVSANYKLSFDRLRQELGGVDGWILVLDTKGINVWCAAGKGTFGTEELVRRIEETGLAGVVSHRTLILPQLAAPGVAAHEVTRLSRFKVVYGPVRAADIRAFLDAGLRAAPEMRRVRFNLIDRLVLTPVELVIPVKYGAIAAGLLLILGAILGIRLLTWRAAYPYLGAIVVGTILVPALLPWIPGRAFSLKGAILGFVWAALVNIHQGLIFSSAPLWPQAAVRFLLLPAISAFLAMYFTGSSTYTSLSGVVREMKYAVPGIAVSAALGLVLLVTVLVGAF